MVFENLTLVELNLENSRLKATPGGTSGKESKRGSEGSGSKSESGSKSGSKSSSKSKSGSESGSSGRSKALPVGLLLVLVVGGLAFRRYRSSGGEKGTGGSHESQGVTIEQAADQ